MYIYVIITYIYTYIHICICMYVCMYVFYSKHVLTRLTSSQASTCRVPETTRWRRCW